MQQAWKASVTNLQCTLQRNLHLFEPGRRAGFVGVSLATACPVILGSLQPDDVDRILVGVEQAPCWLSHCLCCLTKAARNGWVSWAGRVVNASLLEDVAASKGDSSDGN